MKIGRVKVTNFKSLKDIDLELSDLTLLTGVNSCGKSSFIQTLLLLKQNELKFNNISKQQLININGEYVVLGNKRDILFQDTFDEDIVIKLFNKNTSNELIFSSDNLVIKVDFLESSFNIFNDDFQYIMTDRISPQLYYPLSDEHVQNDIIGIKGEYTAHYLAENRHKKVNIKELIHKNSKTEQLLENVSLWLSEISNNIEVKADIQQHTLSAILSYSYTYSDNTTNEYSPLSVGFGVTYVLPIVVSILKAKKDDLVIIENPESHLHPAGQSKIAQLCAIASANGVQIIVETHSDHFLNGIRVATKKEILKPEQSQIYYFRKGEDELETKVNKLNIDIDGRINEDWPEGFFDEYRIQLDELLW
ncbi:DUF3696 domain-containing protein [Thiotrichales bacterium HSG1]|nr:DUF3696 domain-containing protein [Thiotrichales bacterium HSG1]